jgi:hypothetical protein
VTSHLNAVLWAITTIIASAPGLEAQVLQPPPRSAPDRPATEPTRAAHQFVLNVNALSGWEDNVLDEGALAGNPLAPARSSLTGVLSSGGYYRYGTAARHVDANVRAYTNSFRSLDMRAMHGADSTVGGVMPLGRRLVISATGNTRSQPGLTIGSLQSGEDVAVTEDPTAGISELRTTAHHGVVTTEFTLSGRQLVTATAGYSRETVTATTSTVARTHTARITHGWDFRQAVGLRSSFERARHTSEAAEGSVAVDSDTLTLALQVRRRVSRTRQFTVSGGVGAARIVTTRQLEGDPFAYLSPALHGAAQLDLGRTWSLLGEFRREVQTLEGVTQQSFITDVAMLTMGGYLGRSIVVALSGSYFDGNPHQGDVGSFASRGGTGQIQYLLARCCALVTSYSYYWHHLRGIDTIALSYPTRFDRNTVRFGLVVDVPLIGSYPERRRPGMERY